MSRADTYTPTIPRDQWIILRPFVLAVVADVSDHVPYPENVLLHVVAHHAHWAHLVAGMPLSRDALFGRETVAYSVAMMPTRSPSTMGRTRSILLRVGEALRVIRVPTPLPALAAADPSAPYSAQEIEELRSWAYSQRNAMQRASAQALIALGLGAGLPTRDLARIRAVDVDIDSRAVQVIESNFPRIISVRDEWQPDLAEAVAVAEGAHQALFRPGVRFHKNTVHTFVQRSIGTGLTPTTQRMRSTWLVLNLSEGTPVQDLLYMAGIKSLDAVVRYQQFLPAPAHVDWQGMPPDAPASR